MTSKFRSIKNEGEFLETESISEEKALKSFFWLKLTSGFGSVILVLNMSILEPKPKLFGLFIALILHLAFDVTIDNFREIYTEKYLSEFIASEK